MSFRENDCLTCERCSAVIPQALASLHRCQGTDQTRRPANIPPERWTHDLLVRELVKAFMVPFELQRQRQPKPRQPDDNLPASAWWAAAVIMVAFFAAIVAVQVLK